MTSKPRNSLSLTTAKVPVVPEEQTAQHRLRNALAGGISEQDMVDLAKGMTERAKGGDPKAIEQLFKYVIGVAPPKVEIHNHYASVEAAARGALAQRQPRIIDEDAA